MMEKPPLFAKQPKAFPLGCGVLALREKGYYRMAETGMGSGSSLKWSE